MLIRHRVDVEFLLGLGHDIRGLELATDWADEAAAASIAGNPRRGHYLEQLALRTPELVATCQRRALETTRTPQPEGQGGSLREERVRHLLAGPNSGC